MELSKFKLSCFVFLSFFISAQFYLVAAPVDPFTYSNPEQISVTHLDWDIVVDFEKQILRGKAVLSIEHHTNSDILVLDDKQLVIKSVKLDSSPDETIWKLGGEFDPIKGQALEIKVSPDTKKVRIEYETIPEAAGLTWLTKEQTFGKDKPGFFTLGWPINSRSYVPAQDTAQVRMTYSAKITIPQNNGLRSLMTAVNNLTAKKDANTFVFEMPYPVPLVHMALTVGAYDYHAFTPTLGVFAEKEILQQSAKEFYDLPRRFAAAETLAGPNPYPRFDFVMLPPSFAFGGMEGNMLPFITPTLLTGDGSLANLIQHELSHSWPGLSVTFKNPEHVFLHEMMNIYLETLGQEMVDGNVVRADMLRVFHYQKMKEELEELGMSHPDTRLISDFSGRDPDHVPYGIAYGKSFLFFQHLERLVGRERLLQFMQKFFVHFRNQSINPEDFLNFLESELIQKNDDLMAIRNRFNLKAWFYEPGLPDDHPIPQSDEFNKAETALEKWLKGADAKDLETRNWTARHWVHFLAKLKEQTGVQRLSNLDEVFHLTDSQNGEIFSAWGVVAIRNNYEPIYPALERFLLKIGRGKFVIPLFGELSKNSEKSTWTKSLYLRARPLYHSWVRGLVEKKIDCAAELGLLGAVGKKQ
jgi:leukotriene-A4 hydrolase